MEKIVDDKLEIYETKEVLVKTIPKTQIDAGVANLEATLSNWEAYCDKNKLMLEKKLAELKIHQSKFEEAK